MFGPPGGVNTAHGTHAVRARAGHHLAPVPMSSGRNSFEALGNEFSLLAFGAKDADVAAFEKAAQDKHIPLKVIRDDLQGGRDAYEAHFILVRPDQYVVWHGNELTGDPTAILAKAVGADAR